MSSQLGGKGTADRIIDRYELTGGGAEAVRDIFSPPSGTSTSLGVIGFLFLMVAVLSFSRAVQRLFEQTWELSPLSVRNTFNGLLWIGGLVVYTALSGVIHAVLGHTRLELTAALLGIPLSAVFLIWSGWVLSAKRIGRQDLLPFAIVGSAMLAVYSVGATVYVPHLFSTYATRYGVIGAVFAMISTLFCVMVTVVGSAAVGREVHDELDRIRRGERPAEDEVRRQWDEVTAEARSRRETLRDADPGTPTQTRPGLSCGAVRVRCELAERFIEANGVELCTEPFGDPADPPILLVMGIGASMLWWEEPFCRMLADGGRFVIRYDHRDTGRSVTYEPGSPGYTGDDLVADAAGVLDAYGIPAAHLVGVSAGGAFAQLLALDFADRVLSLVLISTSPAVPGDRELPPPTEEFSRFASTAHVDWSDAESVVEYLVAYSRVLAGGQRPFDETAARELARREVERARSFAAAQNHDAIPNGQRPRAAALSIDVPTLVIHGTADPMFPLDHGEALAAEIPGARLLALDRAGHGLDRADWETVSQAILEHTGAAATR